MDFDLRPLEPADAPGIDALLRSEAQTTALAISTRYEHDVYASLVAQHPTLFGVVATTDGLDGLVGMATAFTDDVRVEGSDLPCARLENLKVRRDVRRQGLGRRLAEWRIAEARRRFGRDGVIAAGIDATNAASIATARRWASQLLGPIRVVIAPTTKRRGRGGARVRPMDVADVEAVVDGVNAFYAGYNLYPQQTPERLASFLAPVEPGGRIREYRVAGAPDGSVVAGAAVTHRFLLMTDHVEHVPRVLELVDRVARIFPPDRVIRTVEVSLAWHAPGHTEAARILWHAIRAEWADRASHVAGLADPRTPLAAMFRAGRSLTPRVRLVVPVRSPIPLDESRPVYMWR